MELTHHRPAEGVFLPRQTSYTVGVDLGQMADYTAISVLENARGVLDFNSEFERHTGLGALPQKPASRVYVKHLERLKLGTTYPAVVQHVKGMLDREPLCRGENRPPATLVVDGTGVGKAVCDIFTEAGLKHQAVTITSSADKARFTGGSWHVGKQTLVSVLDAMLNIGELKFAAALTEAGSLRAELTDFRRKLSDAGRASYAARTGAHDDLVLSVAIAAWWIAKPKQQPASFSSYSHYAPIFLLASLITMFL